MGVQKYRPRSVEFVETGAQAAWVAFGVSRLLRRHCKRFASLLDRSTRNSSLAQDVAEIKAVCASLMFLVDPSKSADQAEIEFTFSTSPGVGHTLDGEKEIAEPGSYCATMVDLRRAIKQKESFLQMYREWEDSLLASPALAQEMISLTAILSASPQRPPAEVEEAAMTALRSLGSMVNNLRKGSTTSLEQLVSKWVHERCEKIAGCDSIDQAAQLLQPFFDTCMECTKQLPAALKSALRSSLSLAAPSVEKAKHFEKLQAVDMAASVLLGSSDPFSKQSGHSTMQAWVGLKEAMDSAKGLRFSVAESPEPCTELWTAFYALLHGDTEWQYAITEEMLAIMEDLFHFLPFYEAEDNDTQTANRKMVVDALTLAKDAVLVSTAIDDFESLGDDMGARLMADAPNDKEKNHVSKERFSCSVFAPQCLPSKTEAPWSRKCKGNLTHKGRPRLANVLLSHSPGCEAS
jgi:hypothetical protein